MYTHHKEEEMAQKIKEIWTPEAISKGYAQIVKGKTKSGLFSCCPPRSLLRLRPQEFT